HGLDLGAAFETQLLMELARDQDECAGAGRVGLEHGLERRHGSRFYAGIADPLAKGRGCGAGVNAAKEGWSANPKNWLAAAPWATAAAFNASGCSAASSHRPESSRRSKTPSAAIVSAAENVQCPARWTNTWRSISLLPAAPTTCAYALSFGGTTRPSPVVWIERVGTLRPPSKLMNRSR